MFLVYSHLGGGGVCYPCQVRIERGYPARSGCGYPSKVRMGVPSHDGEVPQPGQNGGYCSQARMEVTPARDGVPPSRDGVPPRPPSRDGVPPRPPSRDGVLPHPGTGYPPLPG